MLTNRWVILLQFNTTRCIGLIFCRTISPLSSFCTLEYNGLSSAFCHNRLLLLQRRVDNATLQ
jgi:hypothetical protein